MNCVYEIPAKSIVHLKNEKISLPLYFWISCSNNLNYPYTFAINPQQSCTILYCNFYILQNLAKKLTYVYLRWIKSIQRIDLAYSWYTPHMRECSRIVNLQISIWRTSKSHHRSQIARRARLHRWRDKFLRSHQYFSLWPFEWNIIASGCVLPCSEMQRSACTASGKINT